MCKYNRSLVLALAFFWSATVQIAFAAEILPEFAYRDISLKFTSTDGKPISGASIYGFCRELNLIWPRQDRLVKNRNDILWDESFLGKTGVDGMVKAKVPPGKWGFFALAQTNGTVSAGWSDFRERPAGEIVRLAPTATKHWTLCSANTVLTPKRLFLKPQGFPIWISASMAAATESVQMEIPPGNFQLWAEGDATADHPGFAMSWGSPNSQIADGKISSPEKTAVVQCKGGKGQVTFRWARRQSFGLEGQLRLCDNATVLLTAGMFSVGYTGPVATGLRGNFVGQLYDLHAGQSFVLNMDSPLTGGLDQILSEPNKKGEAKLIGQLYLVDGNGHILHELSDDQHNPISLEVYVTLNGQRIKARPVLRSVETLSAGEEEEETETDKAGQMLFSASAGSIRSNAGAVWEITSPRGLLSQTRFTTGQRVTVMTPTFKMAVPAVIARDAQNLLSQTEMLAAAMNYSAGKRRRVESTAVIIDPSRRGASGVHNGTRITISTRLFFSDAPMSEHGIVHELGHNFGFHHGGLHETVVETSRCAGADQITEQPAKWMFMDRMNGIPRDETPYRKYHNVGLYLYCYAQGGMNFLHFMSANEQAVVRQLERQGYTEDELTAALLNLAMGRDMTRICHNYGLNFTPERLEQGTQAARILCRR